MAILCLACASTACRMFGNGRRSIWQLLANYQRHYRHMGKRENIAFRSGQVGSRMPRPGNWNDPDMFVVGHVGWGNPHPNKLKPDEQYLPTSVSWVCLQHHFWLVTYGKLDDFTLNLLTNDEVIEINQDPLGKQAPAFRLLENYIF